MPIDLNELHREKHAPITTTEGPVLIIAGPGTGKTTAMVYRVIYMLVEKKILPENIFISTFTDKAARELISRISTETLARNIKINLNEMYIGTLHSIFLRILEENKDFSRLKKNYRVFDEFDQQYFVYRNLNEFYHETDLHYVLKPTLPWWERASSLVAWLNKISEELVDTGEMLKSNDNRIKTLGECHKRYSKMLEEENALDFSSIQSEAWKMIEAYPDVLKKLQEKIKYIIVDEYQDTNTVQEMILLKLAGTRNNICVVGDDDQSLYRFRGATVRNILEFTDNFPKGKCKVFNLSYNHRSHPGIIEFYNEWMKSPLVKWEENGKNFRHQKEIKAQDDIKHGEYDSVIKLSGKLSKGKDDSNWHKEIIAFIENLKTKKILSDYNQLAFLFSSVRNERAQSLANYLENKENIRGKDKCEIPVYSPRSALFFEREEVQLLIGAMIFLFPQYPKIRKWNADAFMHIWDYYDNDCFEKFCEELRKPGNKALQLWAANKAKQHSNLAKNTDYGFSGLFYQLIQFPLFSQYLDLDIKIGGQPGKAKDLRPLYNIALFSQILEKFEHIQNVQNVLMPSRLDKLIKYLFNQYFRFLKDGGIDEFEGFEERAPTGCVSFLTIHQSKGLEYPIVLVDSLGNTPRKQYTEIDEILQKEYYRKKPFEPIESIKYYDFWRLYYTAFSRAQNLLALTTQERKPARGRGASPSAYFKSFYEKLKDWKDAKLANLKLAEIKVSEVKKEYSFTSHILLYENCPLQYKFYRELEFSAVRQSPFLFGSLVHQTIEDIHKRAVRGEIDQITEDNIKDWFESNYIGLTKKEKAYLDTKRKEMALNEILGYANRHKNWDHILEAEVDVSLVKEKYILSGKIDLLRGEDGENEIVDFKTGSKPDFEEDSEELDRYRRQLEVYSHIVEERKGIKINKTHLYFTKEQDGNPYITFSRDKSDIRETVRKFDEIVGKIERKDFRISIRPEKYCEDCDFRHYCDGKCK